MGTQQKNRLHVTKASGESKIFLPSKLVSSLQRSGASPSLSREIVQSIQAGSYDGIPTREIYRKAFRLLHQQSSLHAAKYKLKQAIMELGPTGFPFENFVAALWKAQQFRVRTGQILKGKCVSHEVDVVAEKDSRIRFTECKFHNSPGIRCDVKVPLYVDARFRDLENGYAPENQEKIREGWVVTNTHFSQDAIRYGECAGLHLWGWDYPESGSLRQTIDSLGLHPLTCLGTLRNAEKKILLDNHIVLSNQLLEPATLRLIPGLSDTRVRQIRQEASALSQPGDSRVRSFLPVFPP